MDEERIGLVLAKTSDLRSKIINCIHKTSSNAEKESGKIESEESEASPDAENQDSDVDEDAESLLNIKDALESLEGQLSYLQSLQQQQWYEREAALAEIEHSQKKLLNELKQYKGTEFEVIREAISFASLAEENPERLLLPPYPSRPENGGHLSAAARKFPLQNGGVPVNPSGSGRGSRGPLKWVGGMVGLAVKTGLTVLAVVAIMGLAGSSERNRENGGGVLNRVVELFRVEGGSEENGGGGEDRCPPGKVAVTENGETRCVVKERVEVPFVSVVGKPDVSYGCG
ncbi:Plastid division protein PDV2 [Striga hermonthica]|uniref:Plastid division protein PDV2 n=1 Tax=Striga hermonthica TaxID=68872 RepID=A0A9N7ML50_STRHE|nr:Plastid division protein PDV2 [Striga hermonthica]